jgi:hypothetical protein
VGSGPATLRRHEIPFLKTCYEQYAIMNTTFTRGSMNKCNNYCTGTCLEGPVDVGHRSADGHIQVATQNILVPGIEHAPVHIQTVRSSK